MNESKISNQLYPIIFEVYNKLNNCNYSFKNTTEMEIVKKFVLKMKAIEKVTLGDNNHLAFRRESNRYNIDSEQKLELYALAIVTIGCANSKNIVNRICGFVPPETLDKRDKKINELLEKLNTISLIEKEKIKNRIKIYSGKRDDEEQRRNDRDASIKNYQKIYLSRIMSKIKFDDINYLERFLQSKILEKILKGKRINITLQDILKVRDEKLTKIKLLSDSKEIRLMSNDTAFDISCLINEYNEVITYNNPDDYVLARSI